jgi:hypothetical protein
MSATIDPGHWVGNIDHNLIVEALVSQAARAGVRAEEVVTWTDAQWADLAAGAFGLSFGSVRLNVLLALNDADDEIKRSRRLRAGGAS